MMGIFGDCCDDDELYKMMNYYNSFHKVELCVNKNQWAKDCERNTMSEN
jgi:hypothetical protein